MFRVLHRGWMIIILLFFSITSGFSQDIKGETPELKIKATSDFESGNYKSAYAYYAELLKRYPKDGLFHYYAGICLLKQHTNMPAAIEDLESASAKSMVPPDVFYYLGTAYRENYQFHRIDQCVQQILPGGRQEQCKELTPVHEAEMSGHAMELTLEYNPFEVYESSLFTFADSNYVREIKNKGGRLGVKPDELFTRNEKKGDLTNFYFRPRNLSKGEYVYFAGEGRSKKKGTEIFRVKKSARNGWGEPESIDAVNTSYDEIMPYFDPVSNDLYFASKGHNSMGGFDVFKSHFDQERDSWSEPITLGFPVNSPDNEYLVMPGPDLGTLLLITDRQGLDSMMLVYILQMMEPKKSLASARPEEIRRIGKLGGIESISAIVDLRNEDINVAVPQKTKTPVAMKPVAKNNLNLPEDYQQNVKKALGYQVSADSLSRLAREARIRVREMPDPNERWAWQRKIIAWEKGAGDYQEMADALYAQVKQMENGKKTNPLPPAIEKDTVINDITVYVYKGEKQKPAEERKSKPETRQATISPDAFNTIDEPGDRIKAPVTPDNALNRFVILDKSPYTSTNPFPMNTEIPKGSYYRIQLGVFSTRVGYETFGGISPITAETVEGKNLTRFYAGKFSFYEDARQALEKVRQSGYSDAFIVGWYDGQKIPVSRVLELEKRDSVR